MLPVIERWEGSMIGKGIPEILEGSLSCHQAVIFQCPSRQTLLDYWRSDEYAEIKKLREGASEWQAAIVKAI